MSLCNYTIPALAVVIFLGIISEAHASPDIGIAISKKCLIMLQNNHTTTCPSIDSILTVFPDTSPDVMGKFVIIDGITQRDQTPYDIENLRQYFRSIGSDGRTWIDPPAEVRPLLKMINIESNFDDYPLKGTSYVMPNYTISRGTERYVNYGCTESIIDSDNWLFLVGDTINFMTHNCDKKYTNFDHIKKTYYEKSYQDIRTTYKYKLETWIAETKIRCQGLCFEY